MTNTLKNTLREKYCQVPNEMITDLTLSSGELRVLLYLFTKPDNWKVYNKDICIKLGISEKTLTKYWKTLLVSKWLRREKKTDEKGIFTGGYVYQIGTFIQIGTFVRTGKKYDYSNTRINSNTKENKQKKEELIQKKENTGSPTSKEVLRYKQFLEDLRPEALIKIKVNYSKNGAYLFKSVVDTLKLKEAYLSHQYIKKQYSKRIGAFLVDYDCINNIHIDDKLENKKNEWSNEYENDNLEWSD